MNINEKVYANTGKMMEKYNVVATDLLAGGGEYEAKDGFGWTNGVYLALKKMFGQDTFLKTLLKNMLHDVSDLKPQPLK